MSAYDVVFAGRPTVDGHAPRWFSLRTEGWRALMQLALVYGWRPAGTVPDDAESPATAVADMSAYDVLMAWDARCVTAADAAAFADALERAVRGDGTPAQRGLGREVLSQDLQDSQHPSRQVVIDFVAFLRQGAFAFYYTH
jgi:hypothetical protein